VTPWQIESLQGDLVRLEPLAASHLEDLWAASRDPEVWRWLSITRPASRDELGSWIDEAVAGPDLPFATVLRESGAAVGSTRYLALRPEHRSVEIGWTWLAREAWGSGANAEAKLLMLSHAFDVWGCRRVELKTSTASTCSSVAARTATAPGTASSTTSGRR